jgi:hypothetical protein
MKSRLLSAFSFFCIFFSKCAAFSSDTTSNVLLYLSSKESKLLSLQNIPFFSKSEGFHFFGVDQYGKLYDKIAFKSTYAPGRDALYQGGGALAYYLNPYLYLKTGPSYSCDIGIQRKWKWALQLSYEIPFAKL